MPTDATPEPGADPAPRDALTEAMAELRAERERASGEPADRYWLRAGIALGLRQPGRAALLLSGLEAAATAPGPAPQEGATIGAAMDADAAAGAEDAATASGPAPQEGATIGAAMDADAAAGAEDAASANGDPGSSEPDEVPVRSRLLARSSTLLASAEAETVFGWVEQLSPTEIRRLGNTLTSLLASGASHDLDRGFGLAWTAGTRLPREDLRGLFSRFSELELAVCSTLGGRDLLSAPRSPETGVGVLLSMFVRRPSPAVTEASAILEREGEAGRRALVAIWNAWIAMRYRERIAPPLFEQLVRPWVTVVGPLPEA